MGAEGKILLKNDRWGQILEFLLDHEEDVRKLVAGFSPASLRNEVVLAGIEDGPLRLEMHSHDHISKDAKQLIVYGGYQWLTHFRESTTFEVDNRITAFLASQIGLRG